MPSKKIAGGVLLTCLLAAAVGGVSASNVGNTADCKVVLLLAQNAGGTAAGGMTPGTVGAPGAVPGAGSTITAPTTTGNATGGNTGPVGGAGPATTNNTMGGPATGPGSTMPQTQGFGGNPCAPPPVNATPGTTPDTEESNELGAPNVPCPAPPGTMGGTVPGSTTGTTPGATPGGGSGMGGGTGGTSGGMGTGR